MCGAHLRAIPAVIVTAFLLAACASSPQPASVVEQPPEANTPLADSGGQTGLGGLALPPPLSLLAGLGESKEASSVDDDRLRNPAECFYPLPNQRYSVSGIFIPDYDPDEPDFADIAYSICLFKVPGYAHEPTLTTSWLHTAKPSHANLWLGLGNLDRNRWDWFATDINFAADLGTMEPYLGPSGEVLAVLLLLGKQAAQLYWVRLGENIAPDIQLMADPQIGPPGEVLLHTHAENPDHASAAYGMYYRYDLDGDGVYETDQGLSSYATVELTTPGDYDVGVEVEDPEGAISQTQIEINISDVWDLTVLGEGFCADLALDVAGGPHVVYLHEGETAVEIIHTWRSGGEWEAETVTQLSGSFGTVSIAFNSQNHLGIAMERKSANEILYCTHDGSSWAEEAVQISPYRTDSPLLAYGIGDQPYLLVGPRGQSFDWYSASMLLLKREITGWTVELFDEEAEGPSALAADLAGLPHLVYSALDPYGTEHLPFHQYFDGAEWQDEYIETGAPVSLAIDSADQPHILTLDEDGIGYYNHDGSGWLAGPILQVPDYDSYGYRPILALDNSNVPYVVVNHGTGFSTNPPTGILCARLSGGTWDTSDIYAASMTNLWRADLAVGSDGTVHLAYGKESFIQSSQQIVYATRSDW